MCLDKMKSLSLIVFSLIYIVARSSCSNSDFGPEPELEIRWEFPEIYPDKKTTKTKRNTEKRTFANLTDLLEQRDSLLDREIRRELGAEIILEGPEKCTNNIIRGAKMKELEESYLAPHFFKPSHQFLSVVENITSTELFGLLKQMPKGGVLHAHDTALCSTESLLEFTYWDYLWICKGNNEPLDLKEFKFSSNQPQISKHNCDWILLSQFRTEVGSHEVDKYLRGRFSMHQSKKFLDAYDAWKKFKGIFAFVNGLLTYEPVWKAYYKRALKEFYEDGVQYLEFRSTLPKLYSIDGEYYSQIHTAEVYHDALKEFMSDHPDFIGSKLIYAPSRWVNTSVLETYVDIANKLKDRMPDFFAGFDLVSHEDRGHPLSYFFKQLMNMSTDINFYFHAGETNWYGTETDKNLVDALLLGTKRIGHGYAIMKHPELLGNAISKNIAIEVCPISNQVLQLVQDFRNHPASYLFAWGYPVIIASDDPSFWSATPLSHDFYIAFLGIASANSDLRFLKKLAINSINYSAMNEDEKRIAMGKWLHKWNEYNIGTCLAVNSIKLTLSQ